MTKDRKETDISKFNNDDTKNKSGKEQVLEKEEPLLDISFNDTSEISVPPRLIDQVIGQDEAVEIIKKAALQKRHVMLIGDPGTGKSMLGQAMAELLPKEDLVDILCLPNPKYPNQPRIATLPAGHGTRKVQMDTELARKKGNKRFVVSLFILIAIIGYAIIATSSRPDLQPQTLLMAMFVGFFIFFMLNQSRSRPEALIPKLLVDNSNSKRAPFNDATGSHAGALLGDVRHDPFQSFLSGNIKIFEGHGLTEVNIKEYADKLFEKYSNRIVKDKSNNYEAIFLEKPIRVIGEEKGQLISADVLSVNRYEYSDYAVEIEIENGKKVAVTPEHRIFVQNENGYMIEKPAMKLKKGERIVSIDNEIIIDGEDIASTFSENDLKQYLLYKRFLEVRKLHPTWGYKRISKFLGEKSSKTRWWYEEKHIPKAQRTINWLENKGLLPLKISNSKLLLIAKVLGALFGDGGIFENLNGIFLSSSELESVKEFQSDIEKIFDLDENEFGRIIEGGEKGHSWCYQNTNRAIVRFFLALGAPKGKKTEQPLYVPAWIYTGDAVEEEFFSSFLGSEIGVPKVHISGIRLQTFDLAITGKKELSKNRLEFLNQVIQFLEKRGVKCNNVRVYDTPNKRYYKYRLFISTQFSNVYQFSKEIKLNYCRYKGEKLSKTINAFGKIKKQRYEALIDKGYSAEKAMNKLRLSQRGLYVILSEEW
ncbi:MAG: ATP-binding protein [Candidatus Heimdallarchaeaceae archaeon]